MSYSLLIDVVCTIKLAMMFLSLQGPHLHFITLFYINLWHLYYGCMQLYYDYCSDAGLH